MTEITEACKRGYNQHLQENPHVYSSPLWLAFKAGQHFAKSGFDPVFDCKMSRGYSVRINKIVICKFDKDLNVMGFFTK